MDNQKLQEFNTELTALLTKYKLRLIINQNIGIAPQEEVKKKTKKKK